MAENRHRLPPFAWLPAFDAAGRNGSFKNAGAFEPTARSDSYEPTPDPVSNDRIDQSRQQEGDHEIGREASAFGDRSGNDRRRASPATPPFAISGPGGQHSNEGVVVSGLSRLGLAWSREEVGDRRGLDGPIPPLPLEHNHTLANSLTETQQNLKYGSIA